MLINDPRGEKVFPSNEIERERGDEHSHYLKE